MNSNTRYRSRELVGDGRITFSSVMTESWCASSWRKATSRYVRCESVAFWKASKIFFTATVSFVLRSRALHTTPYAPLPTFWWMS